MGLWGWMGWKDVSVGVDGVERWAARSWNGVAWHRASARESGLDVSCRGGSVSPCSCFCTFEFT